LDEVGGKQSKYDIFEQLQRNGGRSGGRVKALET
jgi:hypothetical protein